VLLPGTITASFVRSAPSFKSSRSLALRALASGPWHLKQLSEKIGNTSRLKSGAATAATGSSKNMMSKKRSIGLSLEDGRVLSSREQRLTDFHRMRGIVWQCGINEFGVVAQEMKSHCTARMCTTVG